MEVSEAPQIPHVQGLTNHFTPGALLRGSVSHRTALPPVAQTMNLGITPDPPSPSPPGLTSQPSLGQTSDLSPWSTSGLAHCAPGSPSLGARPAPPGPASGSSTRAPLPIRPAAPFPQRSPAHLLRHRDRFPPPPRLSGGTCRPCVTGLRRLTRLPLVSSHHRLPQASL